MGEVTLGTDSSLMRLKLLLDLNAARQKTAARNLANCATEGYEPKKVEFAPQLAQALGKVKLVSTNPLHLTSRRSNAQSDGITEVIDQEALASSEVGIERSVTELADAELAYSTAAKLMSKRIATMRTAITGTP
jgi:flagellar basal-body rod protein FlgB